MTRSGLGLMLAVALVALFASVNSALADEHDGAEPVECIVGTTVIACDDGGISRDHGENCDVVHYHGELNGVEDPDLYGCGQGEVLEQNVTPQEEETGNWEAFTDWADALFQGLSGGFSPKAVAESTDIVVEASEGIAANAENAEEYFEVYEDAPDRDRYTLENEGGEHGAFYHWFWGWFE